MNIIPKKPNEYFKFSVTIETLKDIAERFKWLCHYDQLEKEPEKKKMMILVIKLNMRKLY